jgi:hypothetical protein
MRRSGDGIESSLGQQGCRAPTTSAETRDRSTPCGTFRTSRGGNSLKSGHDLSSMDTWGRTPLPRAAEYGHEALVNLLLGKGAELESKDTDGKTSMSWATMYGHEAVVKLMRREVPII